MLITSSDSVVLTNMQELESRALAKGKVNLRVGNRAKVATLVIRTYVMTLPNGLIIQLENNIV